MGSDTHEKKDLKKDGTVILYKRERRDGSILPTWYMRIRVPLPGARGKYFRASTYTTDRTNATQIALNKYEELYMKVKSGGTLKTITYKQLVEEFSEWYRKEPKNEDRKPVYVEMHLSNLKGYPLEFFSKELNDIPIDKITSQHIREYFQYQQHNSYKFKNMKKQDAMKITPHGSTLVKYGNKLDELFQYAYDKKYIPEPIKIIKPKFKHKRRPVFTRKEWRVLTKKMGSWVRNSHQSNVYRFRFMIQHFVLISANCGARVGEMRNLRWGDIQTFNHPRTQEEVLYAEIEGTKQTGTRQMVFQPVCKEYFKRLKNFRQKELDRPVPRDEVLFCHMDGRPVQRMIKSYYDMLEAFKLLYDKNGEKRTLYSLRHTYATFRLEDEVSVHLLAKQMGTSTQMIDQHYGQTKGKMVAPELTKSSSQRTIPTSLVDELYQDTVIEEE